jgi:hypothetical protein
VPEINDGAIAQPLIVVSIFKRSAGLFIAKQIFKPRRAVRRVKHCFYILIAVLFNFIIGRLHNHYF